MSIWSLGSNSHSQLSLNSLEDVSVPSRCTIPESLAQSDPSGWQISCGGNHTLLLTRDGDLYGCGSNEDHQLGLANTSDVMTFQKIHEHIRWKYITAGFTFSVMVSVEDEIYATGADSKGALGLGTDTRTQKIEKVNLPLNGKTISGVAAGLSHVIVQISNGTLYGWGASSKGALGPAIIGTVGTPQLLDLTLDNIQGIAAGRLWSVILHTGQVRLLGSLGKRDTAPPSFQDVPSAVKITSNWSSLHLLSPTGQINSFGRSDGGQHPPADLPPIGILSSGSEHSVAVGSNGKIYVWGWNEHGNCGSGAANVVDIKELDIPGLRQVVGVAAGCATTFIYGIR